MLNACTYPQQTYWFHEVLSSAETNADWLNYTADIIIKR